MKYMKIMMVLWAMLGVAQWCSAGDAAQKPADPVVADEPVFASVVAEAAFNDTEAQAKAASDTKTEVQGIQTRVDQSYESFLNELNVVNALIGLTPDDPEMTATQLRDAVWAQVDKEHNVNIGSEFEIPSAEGRQMVETFGEKVPLLMSQEADLSDDLDLFYEMAARLLAQAVRISADHESFISMTDTALIETTKNVIIENGAVLATQSADFLGANGLAAQVEEQLQATATLLGEIKELVNGLRDIREQFIIQANNLLAVVSANTPTVEDLTGIKQSDVRRMQSANRKLKGFSSFMETAFINPFNYVKDGVSSIF